MKTALPLLFALTAILAASCTRTVDDTVVLGGTDDDAAAPSLGPTNVDPDAAVAVTGSCPSTKCTAPYTTCDTSTFACDVDLSSDNSNCGACGVKCPFVTPLG